MEKSKSISYYTVAGLCFIIFILVTQTAFADPLDFWGSVIDHIVDKPIGSIAFGNNLFVAVGSGGTMITSTDGRHWNRIDPGTTANLKGVAYGNDIFVAVGNQGTSNIRLVSADGKYWEAAGLSGLSDTTLGVSFADNSFVTIDRFGHSLITADGKNWHPGSNGIYHDSTNSFSCFYSALTGGNNTFVAASGYCVFMLTGDQVSQTLSDMRISKDGTVWKEIDAASTEPALMHYVIDGVNFIDDVFVATAHTLDSSIVNIVLTSSDGAVWTVDNAGLYTAKTGDIAYGNGTYVKATNSLLMTSTDSQEWMVRAAFSGYLANITFANGSFTAVGSADNKRGLIISSSDGTDWKYVTTGPDGPLRDVIYVNDMFFLVDEGGYVNISTDLITWKQVYSNTDRLYKITYGDGKFVAVGGTPSTYGTIKIITSPDGTNWTVSKSLLCRSGYCLMDSPYLTGVTYGNGIFVAVGAQSEIMTSVDGSKWVEKSYDGKITFNGVAFGNNTFVTVGSGGTVFVSQDGNTWYDKTASSGTSENLNNISFARGFFVAVGNKGTILTSTDGVSWTVRISGTSDFLTGVSYGNGTFVTGGDHFKILRTLSYTLPLLSGWNFVSLTNQPSNTSIGAVLADISSNVKVAWTYDSLNQQWLHWKPKASDVTLTSVESGHGYWIYMDASADLTISGNEPSSNVHLYKGWNLVGYSGADKASVNNSLSGAAMNGNWSVIWSWDNGQWKVKEADGVNAILAVPELTNLNKGRAYWIKMKQEADWQQ